MSAAGQAALVLPATASEPTVFENILEWSQDRPLWQRDALRRIVQKGKLDEKDAQDLLQLCKQGNGAPTAGQLATPLSQEHLPANPGASAAVSLLSIANIEGVNNLAPGQTLSFEHIGITVIYGNNGTGKSGYARVFKRACRARHIGKIEPNIYAGSAPAKPAAATIAFSIGGVAQQPEHWEDKDHPHPLLSAVSVFDQECASVHINEKNEVAFRPFGLDIPDELAGICQSIKESLNAELRQLEKARNPIFEKPPWEAATGVGKELAALKHDTNMQQLTMLGTLNGEEAKRLLSLREDLAKDPAKAAAEQRLKANNLKHLLDAVKLTESQTQDQALTAVRLASVDAQAKREAAHLAAEKAFSGEPLAGIGGPVWRTLWESARRYSAQVAYPTQPFPVITDARCLLCQQPLQSDAIDRMVRFEEFIKADTEQQAQAAEQQANNLQNALATTTISTRSLKASLEGVALHNSRLAKDARRFLATARLRRYSLLKSLDSAKEPTLPTLPAMLVGELAQLESALRQYAGELQAAASGEERQKLYNEHLALHDRELLGKILPTIGEEIIRLKSIAFLEACLAETSTNVITNLGNALADKVITPTLRDRFQQEIVKLAGEKVRVEIVRSGGKYGAPQYQVRLFANPNAKVKDILSEGEQTCAALATFLTEVATATHCSAFVFDDPVCSLDHRWRKQVAKRLVDEAAHRQIIVLTHDLVFVNDLHDLSMAQKQAIRLHTLSRGPTGTGVVTAGLPWKAQSVEDRIDKLEKATTEAKTLYGSDDEENYRIAAAGIYDNIRATWERALEDIALFRVVQRHRDYIDTKHLKKVTVLSETDCDGFHAGFKKCCDIVDAHDPSSGRNAEAPPPSEIMQDIQVLKNWVANVRERQKKINP